MATRKNNRPRDDKGRYIKVEKSYDLMGQGAWSPLGSSFNAWSRPLDIFGSQASPSQLQLVQVFDDTVYSCISLLATKMTHGTVRIFHSKGRGEGGPTKGRPLSKKSINWLEKQCPARVSKSADITEVDSHDVFDLLDHPNKYFSFKDLLYLAFCYEKVVGASYTLMRPEGEDEPPLGLWVLPAQYMRPEPTPGQIIGKYVYLWNTSDEKTYRPEDLIVVSEPDLNDPYFLHHSPLRAAYERVKLCKSELSYFQQVLLNAGRPDIAIETVDGAMLNPAMVERNIKQFDQLFRPTSGGVGGAFAVPPGMKATPLSFAPNTVLDVEQVRMTKESIYGCFNTPPELFSQASNYATYLGAMRRLAQDNIIPALRRRDAIMTKSLLSRYEEDLFFVTDEPEVEEDPNTENARRTSYSTTVLAVQNAYYGQSLPRDAAVANVTLLGLDQDEAEELFPETKVTQPVEHTPFTPILQGPTVQDKINLAKAVQDLQTAYYGKALPREAAMANAVLLGLGTSEADTLFPEMATDEAEEHQSEAIDGQPAGDAEGESSNDLRATVGGSAAVLAIQQSYVGGNISYEQALANFKLVFGFSPEEAAQMLDGKPEPSQIQAEPTPETVSENRQEPEDQPEATATKSLSIKARDDTALGQKCREVMSRFYSSLQPGFDPAEASQTLRGLLEPIFLSVAENTAYSFAQQFDLGHDVLRVSQPKLQEGVSKWVGELCDSTLATTSKSVEEAITAVKSEIHEGMSEGERTSLIAKRVKSVFENASVEKAQQIAHTEVSRAEGNARIIVAQSSNLKMTKKWLARTDCCDECKALNGTTKALDEPFAVNGAGPYATIMMPPYHPGCFCDATFHVER